MTLSLGVGRQPSSLAALHSLRVRLGVCAILLCCASPAAPQSAVDGQPLRGTITGSVTDETGAAIAEATVTWSQDGTSASMSVATGVRGAFSFPLVPSGSYRLAVSSPGFASQIVTGIVTADGTSQLPPIQLRVAFDTISVDVRPREVIAEEQIKEQEQQRVLSVLPNYYVVYRDDAVALTAKQKFQLFRKSILDPADFAFTGIVAGVQQLRNDYTGFGRGASGYAKRYAALYASIFTRASIDQALLPSVLKQDPRYFFRGTGSTMSRIGYAIRTAVVRKADNGHWQPNYSGILGSAGAGALTNFYYPAENRRGLKLTLESSAIALGTSAAAHLAQEFLFQKVTTRARPRPAPGNTGDDSKR
jgi:uncharacterized lipoprotein YbaY